eukprot:CAMPEP_0170494172 /NCGR_PEP_ID=MMETSP0208-20121228/14489_1 /TAXON_ID=197538 /ORGANISM="Strombidium inclinatum, Strain S3" /LENGTH=154 /DNA_ID=CAMNT_0010770187 /DNA_START=63 /DNA_END=527 /DNA_ORIENTATION=+
MLSPVSVVTIVAVVTLLTSAEHEGFEGIVRLKSSISNPANGRNDSQDNLSDARSSSSVLRKIVRSEAQENAVGSQGSHRDDRGNDSCDREREDSSLVKQVEPVLGPNLCEDGDKWHYGQDVEGDVVDKRCAIYQQVSQQKSSLQGEDEPAGDVH